MKILFFMGHDGFARNFEAPLHLLAERGHSVQLALSGRRALLMGEARSIDDLCGRHPNVSYIRAPKGRDGEFSELAGSVWGARDYLRFLTPEYQHAEKLRARARGNAPDWAQRLGGSPFARTRALRRFVDSSLRCAAESLPPSEEVGGFIREHDPDVVLVTPQINFRSTQNTVVHTAKTLGVPTALLVHSWDNLTNKGLIHHIPDRVLVWNEAQKWEAVELQGVDPNRVVVTGAQCYDHWFDWEPQQSRDEFCGKVGLDPSDQYLLYVCSSAFIAPDEADFVSRWVAHLRSDGPPELERVGVLVRPHPQQLEQWEELAAAPPKNVAIWPAPDGSVGGQESRSDYYESFRHAAAVVGVNTSAFVEAAIMDRPTFTVLAPEYRQTQVGTLHFNHLAEGPLNVAETYAEHHDQLRRVLAGDDLDSGRSARFVRSFVRADANTSSAARMVDAVESLAGAPLRRDEGTPDWHVIARWLMRPAARRLLRAKQGERRRLKAQRARAGSPA